MGAWVSCTCRCGGGGREGGGRGYITQEGLSVHTCTHTCCTVFLVRTVQCVPFLIEEEVQALQLVDR